MGSIVPELSLFSRERVENHEAAIALYSLYLQLRAGASDAARDTGHGSGAWLTTLGRLLK